MCNDQRRENGWKIGWQVNLEVFTDVFVFTRSASGDEKRWFMEGEWRLADIVRNVKRTRQRRVLDELEQRQIGWSNLLGQNKWSKLKKGRFLLEMKEAACP